MKTFITFVTGCFWIFGIFQDPSASVIATWVAWGVITFSIALSVWKNPKGRNLWLMCSGIDLVSILLTLALGGRNWGFDGNIMILILAAVSLGVSLRFTKNHPHIVTYTGAVALLGAYIPMMRYWIGVQGAVVPVYMQLALGMGLLPVLMDIWDAKKLGTPQNPSSWVALVCSGITLGYMLGEARRTIRSPARATLFI